MILKRTQRKVVFVQDIRTSTFLYATTAVHKSLETESIPLSVITRDYVPYFEDWTGKDLRPATSTTHCAILMQLLRTWYSLTATQGLHQISLRRPFQCLPLTNMWGSCNRSTGPLKQRQSLRVN